MFLGQYLVARLRFCPEPLPFGFAVFWCPCQWPLSEYFIDASFRLETKSRRRTACPRSALREPQLIHLIEQSARSGNCRTETNLRSRLQRFVCNQVAPVPCNQLAPVG